MNRYFFKTTDFRRESPFMRADHRYLWSASFVRQRLQVGDLSEAATFRYFFVIMAFDWLQFTTIATMPARTVNAWTSVSAWTTFAITLGGLLYLYLRNGGGTGRSFLLRYFPFSVTVGWKFVLVMMAAMWLIPYVMAGATAEQRGWTATFVIAAINILMFGHIGAHMALLSNQPFAVAKAASNLPAPSESPETALVEGGMEERRKGKLLFVCGKMAAGKSTLSKELAAREDAVLLAQDDLLVALYPGEIIDLGAFAKYSTRIQEALAPLVGSLLFKGVSVVLDFPANTRRQRAWFRQLLDRADVEHELHFIVASDDLCKRQLRQRSGQRGLPPGTKWTTDADFDEVTAYFDPPAAEEHFNVVRHERQP